MKPLRPRDPDTKHAVLMNLNTGEPTLHRFIKTRVIKLPSGEAEAMEDLYECTETGVVRRWGLRLVEMERAWSGVA